MTTKNQKSEKNTLKIDTVLLPLFEDGVNERTINNAIYDFMGDDNLSSKNLDKIRNESRKNCGFVFNPEKTMSDIKALIKANSIPLKNFEVIQNFADNLAIKHFTTTKIVDTMLKTLLGDVYPKKGKIMMSGTKQDQAFKILEDGITVSEYEFYQLILGKGKYPRLVLNNKDGTTKQITDVQIMATGKVVKDYITVMKRFNSKFTPDEINNIF